MANVSPEQRARIKKVMRLAHDPAVSFPANVTPTHWQQFYEYPTGAALIRMECLVPLAFVPDVLGKHWCELRYGLHISLRQIGWRYKRSHQDVGRRIEGVLDRAVDLMRQRMAYYILDVYFTQFGNAPVDPAE